MWRHNEINYLELLVDALQAVDRGVERTDFIALHLKLLFEIGQLVNVCIALGSVLSLKFDLEANILNNGRANLETSCQTLMSAIDSARSTLLVSSSWMVFSVSPWKNH